MTEHAEHKTGVGVFIAIWVALLVLTAITVGASFLDLGRLNPVVALVIATCKALLVILFFMEVRFSTRITKMVVVSGVFFLFLLLGLTMSDYLTRAWMTTR